MIIYAQVLDRCGIVAVDSDERGLADELAGIQELDLAHNQLTQWNDV